MNVKETQAAIEIAERLVKLLRDNASDKLCDGMKKHNEKPRSSTETYSQGFQQGLNIAGAALIPTLADLDVNEVCRAVYGDGDSSH